MASGTTGATPGPDKADDGALATVRSLAETPTGPDGLTRRQRLVLDTIRASVEERGYPPSMREIGESVGLTSPSSVKHQLTALERKGYLRRDPNRPRAIEVVQPDDSRAIPPLTHDSAFAVADVTELPQTPAYVPVVGRIAAGGPILAEQVVEDVFPSPASSWARASSSSCASSATPWWTPRSATVTGSSSAGRTSRRTGRSSPR
ncbi:hypothetical protein GCM10025864_41720 [Luteimicrobium album]|uniref:LexA repressor DNA-binding domain-containing protein n=1 Tax=Luteimicrobium album TaxID=1054550 RepID=A0ABQ6I6J6_9MICO|nr:hypothetical protein GCM10025864_41720 [Luteimicrobium album]